MIKNVFYGVMFRHINPVKEHPERIKKIDKKIACNLLNYDKIKFPVKENDF